jgi:hypothetical protein
MNSLKSIARYLALDRLLTLYVFRPLLHLKEAPRDPKVAILMYHSISEPDMENTIHPYYETCTSPKVFAQHMKFLHENNYPVISLDQAANLLRVMENPTNPSNPTNHLNQTDQADQNDQNNSTLDFAPNRPKGLYRPNRPDRPYVVLTFDDGYRDFSTHAFPILCKYGFSATVFLPTASIGPQPKKFKGKLCLSWKEVKQLFREGVAFGSHTVSHAKLTTLNKDQVEFEPKLCVKE